MKHSDQVKQRESHEITLLKIGTYFNSQSSASSNIVRFGAQLCLSVGGCRVGGKAVGTIRLEKSQYSA